MYAAYRNAFRTPSDINEHLPVLYAFAKQCSTIVECGVRYITSSYAFAHGLTGTPNNRFVLVDPYRSEHMDAFLTMCANEGVNAEFVHASDLQCPLVETDLLFIDTWHVYGQLKRELEYWNSHVRKYIILHDTTVDAIHGETIRMKLNAGEQSRATGIPLHEITKGLWPAVEEFLVAHPEWELEYRFTHNNGLTILRRKDV